MDVTHFLIEQHWTFLPYQDKRRISGAKTASSDIQVRHAVRSQMSPTAEPILPSKDGLHGFRVLCLRDSAGAPPEELL